MRPRPVAEPVVLRHSRLLWLLFYRRQTMAVLTAGLKRAFVRFGGVPTELLFDQMRAVVLSDGRVGSGELVLNAECLRVAVHRGFTRGRAGREEGRGGAADPRHPGRLLRRPHVHHRRGPQRAGVALAGGDGHRAPSRHAGQAPGGLLRSDRPYRRFGVRAAPVSVRSRVPETIRVERRSLQSLRGGGGMTAAASERRDQLQTMLADLSCLAPRSGRWRRATAGEAIELVLSAQIALRNIRRLQAVLRSSRLSATLLRKKAPDATRVAWRRSRWPSWELAWVQAARCRGCVHPRATDEGRARAADQ